MMFSSFTFMMNLTINLMNESYHKCETKKNDPLFIPEVPKNYSL